MVSPAGREAEAEVIIQDLPQPEPAANGHRAWTQEMSATVVTLETWASP
jgi:hypothetical protein